MAEHGQIYTPVSNRALKWLTDPGSEVPTYIRDVLIGELLTSPKAVLLGVANGLLLNATALWLSPGPLFLGLIPVTLALAGVRLLVYRWAAQAAELGRAKPTDLNLISAILWCVLTGALAFAAMRTGVHPLQVLAATSVVGVLGAICGRNFAAPRLAVLLMTLCVAPLLLGAALAGEPWLLVLAAQIPLYFYGNLMLVSRFRTMSIAILRAEQESMDRARRDPLTGLLNRRGVRDILTVHDKTTTRRLTFFYLDLDGFKQVNDRYGHQAGDELLQQVARRLLDGVRTGDGVARIGGDEFVVVALGMTPADSPDFAERMIRAVTDAPYQLTDAADVRIGVSVGYVCAPEDCTTVEEINRNADAALYQAKAAGKGVPRRFRRNLAPAGQASASAA